MTKWVIRIWAILAILSMLVYAFTTKTAWAPIDTQLGSDVMRGMLLTAIHIAWVPVFLWSEDLG